MSKKANSKTPGAKEQSLGFNYLMDGYDFDMDYGSGVEDPKGKELLPQPPQSGFSKLPGSIIMGNGEEGEDIVSMMSNEDAPLDLGVLHLADGEEVDGEGASLEDLALRVSEEVGPESPAKLLGPGVVDLSWLSEAVQDPDRLPTETDVSVEELQECWGDRTDGIYRIDLRDRQDLMADAFTDRPEDAVALDMQRMAAILRSAMRKSAAGVPLPQILRSLREQVPPSERRTLTAHVNSLIHEHGLHGNVFVRASAYPGLHQGKWAKEFKKAASKAKYIIACPSESCGSCSSAMGLKEIKSTKEIDWSWVYDQYAPGLKAAGRLKSASSKRESLQKAFLRKEAKPQKESNFITHVAPSDTVSTEDAYKALKKAKKQKRAKFTKKSLVDVAKLNAEKQLRGWNKQGKLSDERTAFYLRAKGSPAEVLRRAAYEIATSETHAQQYVGTEGLGKYEEVSEEHAQEQLRLASEYRQERWLRKTMSEGFAGRDLDALVSSKFGKKASSQSLFQIRRKHEGLSGHLYVDAEAYAHSGLKGCKEGGLKHRGNQIKHVLAFDQCGGCLEAQKGVCGVYNKKLAKRVPHDNPASYQERMIEASNHEDYEAAAALFQGVDILRDLSPSEEFGLHNASLDDIEYDDAPEGPLDDILFGGGMEL